MQDRYETALDIIQEQGAEIQSLKQKIDNLRRFSIELIGQRYGGYMARTIETSEIVTAFGETKQEAIGSLIEILARRAQEIWAVTSITERRA